MVGMWNAVWMCKCGRSLRTMLGNRAFLCSVLESFEGAWRWSLPFLENRCGWRMIRVDRPASGKTVKELLQNPEKVPSKKENGAESRETFSTQEKHYGEELATWALDSDWLSLLCPHTGSLNSLRPVFNLQSAHSCRNKALTRVPGSQKVPSKHWWLLVV